tara:strand:- start:271 stop:627 length:357 start_codon:yes stop_codon:yes gene_type:complete
MENKYADVEELIEHKPIDNIDFEDLNLINDRLLIGKYDLGKIKSIDYKQISKLNAGIFDFKRELDFWINITNFLKSCSYFKSDYTTDTISHIKKNNIERLNYYIDELEQEIKLKKEMV